MNPDRNLLAVASRLLEAERPCALVSVLRAQAPTSARAGDKAVVDADGVFHGWIGGGCAQPAVLRAVRQALADGRPRLVRIAPAADGQARELDDVLEFGMACHSGGTLELFIDPMAVRPRLVVIGDTPVAAALAALAPQIGLAVTIAAQGARADRFPDARQVLDSDDPAKVTPHVPPGALIVVATQGRRDLQGLRLALALQGREVSLIASARKAGVLKQSLKAAGLPSTAVDAIVAPAGLPISAQTPEEIALSVLAQAVASHRRRALDDAPAGQDAATVDAVEADAVEGQPACCGNTQHEHGLPASAAPLPAVSREMDSPEVGSPEVASPEAASQEGAFRRGAPPDLTAVALARPRASCCGE